MTPEQIERIQKLRAKYGVMAGDPETQVTPGNAGAQSTYDRIRAKYGVQGEYTDRGTFVPGLTDLYERRDQELEVTGQDPLPSELRRRQYAVQALKESVKTEEKLREFGIDVPPEGTEAEQPQGYMRYLKYPLAVLQQLQRGQFAVVGGIKGILDGEPDDALRNFYRGLIYAEPHSVGDILEKYDLLENDGVGKFATSMIGDILLDPLTWLSFGTYGMAKGAISNLAGNALKATDVLPHLSRFGKKALAGFMQQMPEEAAVRAIVDEVRKGGVLGKKLIPHGVRVANWVPSIGGMRVSDVAPEFLKMEIVPGGVMQRVDDLRATQTFSDKITEWMLNNKALGPMFKGFGEAFIPHFLLKRKYPLLAELESNLQFNDREVIRKNLEKVRELIKLVKDPEERKLLTQLYQEPHLLLGKKFVTMTKRDPGTLEARINMDYFTTDIGISENDAEELVDFFLETRNALKGGVMIEGKAKKVRPETWKLGGGAQGGVYGGSKFEALRPTFEAMIAAHPNMKAYKIDFGNWVVKIPGYGGLEGIVEQGVGVDEIANMMAEIHVTSKLGGTVGQWGIVPATVHTFRRVDQMLPELVGKNVGKSFTIAQLKSESPQAWWAYVQGAWRDFKNGDPQLINTLGIDPASVNSLDEFALALDAVNPVINGSRTYVPVLVKKHIKGHTYKELNGVAFNSKDWKGAVDVLVHKAMGLHKVLKGAARTGITPGDLKADNIILDVGDNVNWVDNSHFIDWIREVQNGNLDPSILFVKPLPGEPGFMSAHGPVEGAGRLGKATEAGPVLGPDDLGTAIIRGGIRKANQENEKVLKNYINRYLKEYLDNTILKDTLTDEDVNQIGLRLLQSLERKKVIKSYKWDGKNIVDIELEGFDVDVPISKVTTPSSGGRIWEEQVEVLVEKHPALLKMSADDQDRLLAAYNLAKSWKQEIEAIQTAKEIQTIAGSVETTPFVDPKKFTQYTKQSEGLQHLPGYQGGVDVSSILNPSRKSVLSRSHLAEDLHPIKGDTIGSGKKIVGITEANRQPGVFYEDDIADILFRNAVEVGLASNARDTIQEAIRLWGKPVPTRTVTRTVDTIDRYGVKKTKTKQVAIDAPDPGYQSVKHAAFKGMQVPDEVAQVLTRYVKTVSGESGGYLWRSYDKILGAWKGWATYNNPGFHGRNFMSNLFQLYLKDGPWAMWPGRHTIAAKILSGAKGELKLPNGTVMPYEDVLKLTEKHGVYGRGWFGGDIKSIQQIVEPSKEKFTAKWNPLNPNSSYFTPGKYLGGVVENESRMVGFVNDLLLTGNPEWAAMNTKKFLFDFTDLTEFEAVWMKRFMPFYTWMRKNMALQAEQIIMQPAKYGNVARAKDAIERQAPETDDRWVPTYFPELYAVKTPATTARGNVLYLNPNLPFQDLNRMFSPQDWLSSLTPFKTVLELAVNKNMFTMRDIQKFKGERVEWPFFSVLPQSLQNKLMPLLGVEQVYEKETGRWFWGIPPKVKYALDASNPFMRNLGKFVATPTGDLPWYQQEKAPYDVMSWLTGVKLIPYDSGAEMEKNVFRRRDIIRDVEKSAEQRGKIPSYYLPDVPRSH